MALRNPKPRPMQVRAEDKLQGTVRKPSARYPRFAPDLEILPPSQLKLWSMLRPVRDQGFVLYGGTAIALRLGHRASVDFDFFSDRPLAHPSLLTGLPFSDHAQVVQEEPNTLTLLVNLPEIDGSSVKVSFFGGIGYGRVGVPELSRDGVLVAASMLDLLGTKLKVIQQRADKKDYLDIHAMLRNGMKLDEGLAAARLLYGRTFQPSEALKALAYFGDGNLREVPRDMQTTLIQAASRVEQIPDLSLAARRLDLEDVDE